MSTAFIFPGQGSQFVGMGKALHEGSPAARAVFEQVDEALATSLSNLIFEGSEDDLRLTENAQPAIMTVSLAALACLEEATGKSLIEMASFVAGHSLGEYSALAAAGSLDIAQAAKLVRLRGQAMQRAVPVGEGAMAAILGLERDAVDKVTEEAAGNDVCVTANDNSSGQIVISGNKSAVERAIPLAQAQGAKRAVLLDVSAPFHCPLMQPAADAMQEALSSEEVATPFVPVVANVTAKPVTEPETIRNLLVQQVTGQVRWRESVQTMASLGVDRLVELGPGNVLSGLARRIDRSLTSKSLGDPGAIGEFAETANA